MTHTEREREREREGAGEGGNKYKKPEFCDFYFGKYVL